MCYDYPMTNTIETRTLVATIRIALAPDQTVERLYSEADVLDHFSALLSQRDDLGVVDWGYVEWPVLIQAPEDIEEGEIFTLVYGKEQV